MNHGQHEAVRPEAGGAPDRERGGLYILRVYMLTRKVVSFIGHAQQPLLITACSHSSLPVQSSLLV